MIQWLLSKWRAQQRRIDMETLWPACKKYAPDLDHAKAAFMLHCANDTAWTKSFTHAELQTFVGMLT